MCAQNHLIIINISTAVVNRFFNPYTGRPRLCLHQQGGHNGAASIDTVQSITTVAGGGPVRACGC